MSQPEEPLPSKSQPVSEGDALATCAESWLRAHKAAMASNSGRYDADETAAAAYLQALPILSGAENIRAFIACVAHGLAIGIVEGATASRLLYAAQVAKSMIVQQPPAAPTPGNGNRKQIKNETEAAAA